MDQNNVVNMEVVNLTIAVEQPKAKGTHDGARAGAGGKRVYENKWASKRFKVSRQNSDLAKAFIYIAEHLPASKVLKAPKACMFDGVNFRTKRFMEDTFREFEAVCSWFSLNILPRSDVRVFALAWVLTSSWHGIR